MSGIVLSAATRSSLLAAQGTADLMAQTQNRLATGKKVNSALDNPINFFTASGLNNRAGDLSALLDSISNGVQTIQAASTGITNIQKLVDSAKSIANQAIADKTTLTSGAAATAASITGGIAYQGGSYAVNGTNDFTVFGAKADLTVTVGGKALNVTLDKSTLGSVAGDLSKVSATDMVTAINNQISNDPTLKGTVSANLTSDGRITFSTTGTGKSQTVSVAQNSASVDIGFGRAVVGAASAATIAGGAIATAVDLSSATGKSFTVNDGHKTVTINLDNSIPAGNKAAVTSVELETEINKQLAAAGSTVKLGDDGTNYSFTTTDAGTNGNITITGADATSVLGVAAGNLGKHVRGVAANATAGAAISGTGSDAVGSATINPNRQSLAAQYKSILDQIDQLANDASYNGVNLLNDASASNKLHITFNDKGTSSIDIQGQDATSTGLALKDNLKKTAADGGFQSDSDIQGALDSLNAATYTLRSQASRLGSNLTVVQNRQDFTKNLINVLQTGSANLTNADLNEEAANSQALSTRQSLAISALSLANTAQQGVLKLLQ